MQATGTWASKRSPHLELAFVSFAFLAMSLPFLGKAFHIDDPVYVWIAQRVVEHPLDPFGFAVNWRGDLEPLDGLTNNPPLSSYYLALVGSLAGWSERAMHTAYLLPALATVWGTWALARSFGANGATAALILVLAPGFFVSSTTLMIDGPMLALWVAAMACWDRGLRSGRRGLLLAGAVLAGLSPLAKYPGLALLPLLVAHALLLRVGWRRWAPYLLVPVGIFGVYTLHTTHLYGRVLVLDPVAYSGLYRPEGLLEVLGRVLTGLAFTGAGAASLLGAAPRLLGWSGARAFGILGLALALGMVMIPDGLAAALQAQTPVSTAMALQLAFWSTAGVAALALAGSDARAARSPESVLLLLWVFGIFVYASLLNWSVSVRGILPLLPPLAILAARRIERNRGGSRIGYAAGLATAALLSLVVARADARLAESAREAAHALVTGYPGREVWFQGHWGFQYYAELLGARAMQRGQPVPEGAIILQPHNNSHVWRIHATPLERRSFAGPVGCSTLDGTLGAGFYASTWGPMPFAFGAVSPEIYTVYESRGNDGGRPR